MRDSACRLLIVEMQKHFEVTWNIFKILAEKKYNLDSSVKKVFIILQSYFLTKTIQ